MRRNRNAKIVATLGPASATRETIEALFRAGADVFRLNFSHGNHEDHAARFDVIRSIERDLGRPVSVLLDLQGPKLRVGTFADGPILLRAGDPFRFDLQRDAPGDQHRVTLPHPEIFAALTEGTDLLVDDGRVRLRVERFGADFADMRVINGGAVSDRKGVNVPGVVLPMSAITEKDRRDLAFGLTLGHRLGGGLIRAARRGHPRNQTARARPRGHLREARKARGDQRAGRDRRRVRRDHGRARRSGCGDARRSDSRDPEAHRAGLPQGGASRSSWPPRCSNR